MINKIDKICEIIQWIGEKNFIRKKKSEKLSSCSGLVENYCEKLNIKNPSQWVPRLTPLLGWKHEILMGKPPDFTYENGMHFIAKTDDLTCNKS